MSFDQQRICLIGSTTSLEITKDKIIIAIAIDTQPTYEKGSRVQFR